MKIFGWIQRINGKQTQNRPSKMGSHRYFHSMPDSRKDEFSDWPDGLLAIGTFGNHRSSERRSESPQQLSHDLCDFTVEEVGKLQMELAKLLKIKPVVVPGQSDVNPMAGKPPASLPLDRFLNCPSSLEVDRRITADEIARNISLVKSKVKDVKIRRTMSFLLKKVFVCHGGFAPTPSLRDPNISEPRVEKMLRAMLHKKMYMQSSTPNASTKKYLGSRNKKKMNEKGDQDHKEAKEMRLNDGGIWVRTDSDFIVLEI